MVAVSRCGFLSLCISARHELNRSKDVKNVLVKLGIVNRSYGGDQLFLVLNGLCGCDFLFGLRAQGHFLGMIW